MRQRVCPVCRKLQPMNEQNRTILVGDLVYEKTDLCCAVCGCFVYSETKPKEGAESGGN